MNQKTAFKILGLGPGVSLVQAKKAFRDLAKQYHPDRYPPGLFYSDEIGAVQAEARMDRMKQINRAFHFLAPLLAETNTLPGKASTDNPPLSKEKKAKTDLWFPEILRMLKKGLKLKFYSKTGDRPRPSVKQSLKSKARRADRAGQTARFATILHTLHPGIVTDKQKKGGGRDSKAQLWDSRDHPRASKGQPYGNFIKYMDLKKKIDARTRSEQNFNRIEKIRPVTRVNPIGYKDKS